MALFYYQCVGENRCLLNGKLFCADRAEAVCELIKMGYSPVYVEKTPKKSKFGVFSREKPFNAREMAQIAERLYAAASAGVALQKALALLSSGGGGKNGASAGECFRAVEQKCAEGGSLHEAFAETGRFSDFFVALTETGEKSGRLPDVFRELSSYYEWEDKCVRDIQGAAVYPAFTGVMLLLAVFGAFAFLMPSVVGMFGGDAGLLPLPTRVFLALGGFAQTRAPLLLVCAAALCALTAAFFSGARGRRRVNFLQLKLPVLRGIYVPLLNYRMALNMKILLGAGVLAGAAVETSFFCLCAPYLEKRFEEAVRIIEKGGRVNDCLRSVGFFGAHLVAMAETGEETGRLPQTFDAASGYYKRELDAAFKRASAATEPALTVVLGVLVGFLALSVILPTFSLINAM